MNKYLCLLNIILLHPGYRNAGPISSVCILTWCYEKNHPPWLKIFEPSRICIPFSRNFNLSAYRHDETSLESKFFKPAFFFNYCTCANEHHCPIVGLILLCPYSFTF